MGIIDYMRFLFSYRHNIYKLRKKYDRTREKADRSFGSKRLAALRTLDQVEPMLVILEEQEISGFERVRLASTVSHGIENAERLLREKEQAKPKGKKL